MRKFGVSFLAFALSCATAAVWAAQKMKPGLWEMTVKSDMFKDMQIPKLSPQELKQMRDMGVNVPQMQDGGIVSKICISREMAERDEAPQMYQKETGCQSKNYQRSGNTYSLDIVCDGADMKGTGKIRGTYVSSESFTSTYSFKGTMHGQPISHQQESSGKWLSSDCGSIKPVDQPAQRR